ncbi:hypothetical protein GIY23_08730 [Allosaccharopolyspora coralli]|uniref:Uncharacterized protein n=1 Tax=Allosaccharopolyspora coralli TaxID=2665642 RepID=A0A5Q3Q6W9_9PSEU|nr:hypothetical protein [Allosaccharopolyspora coralli]QGK69590.1 hypothetical protein GIY23_08730 [Allosaccharopolyspora coralli]
MTNTAHIQNASAGAQPVIVVRDDRGATITELVLPAGADSSSADDELRAAGWSRSAAWSTADDGWLAPVVEA